MEARQRAHRMSHQASLRSLVSASENGTGTGDSLDEARVMQEIIDEILLDIDVVNLTEAEQDLLSDRIAEMYRQRHPRASASAKFAPYPSRPQPPARVSSDHSHLRDNHRQHSVSAHMSPSAPSAPSQSEPTSQLSLVAPEMSDFWAQRPISHDDRPINKNHTESLAQSVDMGMSWGAASVGSWIRDDMIMSGTSPFAFNQSPSYHSSSYLPKLEADYMRDFVCCGAMWKDLHALLTHYEETHAQQDPTPSRTYNTRIQKTLELKPPEYGLNPGTVRGITSQSSSNKLNRSVQQSSQQPAHGRHLVEKGTSTPQSRRKDKDRFEKVHRHRARHKIQTTQTPESAMRISWDDQASTPSLDHSDNLNIALNPAAGHGVSAVPPDSGGLPRWFSEMEVAPREDFLNQTQYQSTIQPDMSGTNVYKNVEIKDNGTAIIGNHYGQFVQQIHYHGNINTSAINSRYPTRVERQNQVWPSHTLETITTFQDGGPFTGRGVSSKTTIKWTKEDYLGEGTYGEVHRESQSDDESFPKNRAVKIIRRRRLTKDKIDYKRELGALMSLSRSDYNQHFVEFYTWYENSDNVFIAMEFVPGGDLSTYVVGGMPEEDVKIIACQIMEGINILHRVDIVHRDIKPANILVVTGRPVWWVKISDFGISKNTTTKYTALRTNIGTTGYQAPEVFASENGKTYDAKCDIWSFACLLHEISTGKVPFAHPKAFATFCDQPQIKNLPQDNAVSPTLAELLMNLLQPDPEKRPTAEDALTLVQQWSNNTTAQQQSDSTQSIIGENLPKADSLSIDREHQTERFAAQDNDLELDARSIDSALPEPLKQPILREIQLSAISHIDRLVNHVYEVFKCDYFPTEQVIVSVGGEKHNGTIRERSEFPRLRDPETGEVIREAFSRYIVKMENGDKGERIVEDVDVSRNRKAFTKQMLKSFIMSSVTREARTGAPWLVKPSLAQYYQIDTNVPPHQLLTRIKQ